MLSRKTCTLSIGEFDVGGISSNVVVLQFSGKPLKSYTLGIRRDSSNRVYFPAYIAKPVPGM
jgi:hypothetical protein